MIPKAELHCHIEGAAEPDLVFKQAKKYNIDPTGYIDPVKGYIWDDFSGFLKSYDFVASLFRTPEDYVQLTETHFLNLAKQGCLYGEIFASPDHASRIGCSYETLIQSISEGIYRAKDATKIEGRIIITGVRHAGVDAVTEAANLAVKHTDKLVTGFGMAGDERIGEVKDFVRAFDIARDGGLSLTVHAGEFAGADSVRNALDYFKVTRIGHGVRAIEDPDLVSRLADEKITLEVCPASNIALNVYDNIKAHPFKKLDQAGCMVTLNSDDPPHFHTSISNEYDIASTRFGYNNQELCEFTKRSLDNAFVDEETRKMLLEELSKAALHFFQSKGIDNEKSDSR